MIKMVQRIVMEAQERGWDRDEMMTEIHDRCTPKKPEVNWRTGRCPICRNAIIKNWESAVAVFINYHGLDGWDSGAKLMLEGTKTACPPCRLLTQMISDLKSPAVHGLRLADEIKVTTARGIDSSFERFTGIVLKVFDDANASEPRDLRLEIKFHHHDRKLVSTKDTSPY